MYRQRSTQLILSCLLVLTIGAASAVAGTKWARIIGGLGTQCAESVCPTADGGYACVGYTLVGASSFDVLVFKLDASGNTIWQKTFSGPTHDLDARIIQTSDGGYLCTASTLSFGAGGWDAWILRLDPLGNVIWQKTCGLAGNDEINSVLQAADGGFFFVGSTIGRVPGWGIDLWLGKLSPTGDLAWEKRWGGPAEDIGLCADQVYGGDFLVSGYTKSYGAGGSDGWVLRLTQWGNLVWQRTYGGVADDEIGFISETSIGDFVACGYTDSYGPVGTNAWVLRMDLVGNIIWQQAYSGAGSDRADTVLSTSDGGLGLFGTTDSFGAGRNDFWAMELNSDGSINWQRTYGGSGNDGLIAGAWPASGPVMLGWTESLGGDSAEALVIRASEDGQIDSSCGALSMASTAIATRTYATPTVVPASSGPTFSVTSVPTPSIFTASTTNTLLCASSDGVDLTGSWSRVRASGSRLNATFLCENAGTAEAGAFTVQFYLSRTARPDSRSRLIRTWTVSSLAAGEGMTSRLRASKSSRDKYLVAIIDTTGAVDEQDESDNTIAYRLPR